MASIKWEDIQLHEKIGSGGFGVVHRGTYSNKTVAIKQFLEREDLSDEAKKEFDRELKIWSQIQSPHIVPLLGYCSAPHFAMIMELMPKRSLYTVIRSENLSWQTRKQIAIGMVKGLNYLHSKKILHRDIKSLNVLLDEDYTAKLSDFGLAIVKNETKSIRSSKKRPAPGTFQWMAPELFGLDPVFSIQSDIYALGITFWELATRKSPYINQPEPNLIINAVKSGRREKIPEDCPKEFADVIKKCWSQNPKARPLTQSILESLQAWVVKEEVYSFKIAFLGSPCVGKTSLFLRLTQGAYKEEDLQSTVGFDLGSKTVSSGDRKIKMNFWDTAGQERFNSVAKSYVLNAQGLIIVYDLTMSSSFEEVTEKVKNFKKDGYLPENILLVANKCDREEKREVAEKEGRALADQLNSDFIETSAKQDSAFSEFEEAVTKWVKGFKNPSKFESVKLVAQRENDRGCWERFKGFFASILGERN